MLSHSRPPLLAGLTAFALLAAASAAPAQVKKPPVPGKKAKGPEVPEVNRKVLAYCAEHLGEKVDNGECAMLVVRAFEAADARTRRDVPKPDVDLKDDDYVWGKLLGPKDAVLPGDVIQFRDVRITTKAGNRTSTFTMGHHTAVVKEVVAPGHYVVLHQNAGGPGVPEEKRKTVQTGDFDLNNKTKGEFWVYRPLAK